MTGTSKVTATYSIYKIRWHMIQVPYLGAGLLCSLVIPHKSPNIRHEKRNLNIVQGLLIGWHEHRFIDAPATQCNDLR